MLDQRGNQREEPVYPLIPMSHPDLLRLVPGILMTSNGWNQRIPESHREVISCSLPRYTWEV